MRASMAAAVLGILASPVGAVPASFGKTADAILLAGAPRAGPGISAVVSENGKILWSGASGKADLASGSSLNPNSLFRYASITKQFTAALVLKYVDDGRLSLNDTLGKLLPAETPQAWHAVTVRQLLNHSSGIPSYTGQPGWMVEANTSKRHTTQQLIDVTRAQPLEFAPGSTYRYNNTGYVLLSAIVEKLSGKPWYTALRERITNTLGLTSVRCGCEPGPALVGAYTGNNAAATSIDMTVPSGAGALVGTARDLAKWAAALHGGKVLKPATYQTMITPSAPITTGDRYGFGLGMGEVRGMPTIQHSGGIFGFSTESIYVPSRKLFVVALANSDAGEVDPGTTARRLLAQAAGKPFPTLKAQALDLQAVEPFFGIYKDKGGERHLYAKDGKLFTRRVDGGTFEVFSAGKGRFFYGQASLSYFDLVKTADGKALMQFYANGALQADLATWAGPIPQQAATVALSNAQLDHVVGTYAVGPAVMTIVRGASGLTGQLTGQPPIGLEAIGPLEFRTVGVDARLMFEEKDGRVSRVVLHQNGRTIPFERQ